MNTTASISKSHRELNTRRWKSVSAGKFLAVAVVYFLTGLLGLQVSIVGNHITLLWLPSGIAVAVMFRWGLQFGYAVWIGAMAINFFTASNPLLGAAIATGNTLGAMCSVVLLRWWKFDPAILNWRDVAVSVVSCLLGFLVSATGGVLSLMTASLLPLAQAGRAWTFWWLGDSVGAIVGGMALLTFNRESLLTLWSGPLRSELLFQALVVTTLSMGWIVVDAGPLGYFFLASLGVLTLAWSAIRLGPCPTAFIVLIYSIVAAVSMAMGRGPFIDADVNLAISGLWAYMATWSIVGMLVCALSAERMVALQRYAASEARFRVYTTLSSKWFWEQDEHLRFTEYFGPEGDDPNSTPAKHVGKTRWELPFADMQESDWQRHRQQLERREPFRDFEIRRLAADGQLSYLITSGSPQFDASGQFKGYLGVASDITVRRRMEIDAQISVRRHQLIMSHLYGGILLVSAQGKVEFANQYFCDMFELDLKPEQLFGLRSEEVMRLLANAYADPAVNAKRIQFIVEAGQPVKGEEVPMKGNRTFLRDFVPIVLDGQALGRLWCHHDITTRLQTQEGLRRSVAEKDALLREVHHRVKNNLQVITSLLRLESSRSDQPQTRKILEEMQGRVRSMAMLHESLYRTQVFDAIELGRYLTQLSTQVFRTLATDAQGTRLVLDIDAVQISMDQATPCGLLVYELISNSLKHGFPDGRGGVVRIALKARGKTPQWQIIVSDDGVGLPDDFDEVRTRSLGLQLVSDLVMQLDGALETGSGPGAQFTLTFTPAKSAASEGIG